MAFIMVSGVVPFGGEALARKESSVDLLVARICSIEDVKVMAFVIVLHC